jgi:hypothetical protein
METWVGIEEYIEELVEVFFWDDANLTHGQKQTLCLCKSKWETGQ